MTRPILPGYLLVLICLGLGSVFNSAWATSNFELKLLTYNIKYSFGFQSTNGEIYDIAEAIADENPDVIALQEVGDLIREGEFERQAENLAIHLTEITGDTYEAVFLGRKDHDNNWDMPLWAESHGVSGSGDTALVSRLTLSRDPEFLMAHRDPLSAEIEFDERLAADPAYRTTGNRPFGITRATYDVPSDGGTTEVDFYSVHLKSGVDNDMERTEQMHSIERLVRPGVPAFLMGDLNAKGPEVDTFTEWKNLGEDSVKSYSAATQKKQIDWILYRNISEAQNISFYQVVDGSGDPYTWSDHTPVVLDAEYETCEPYDPAAFSATFCSGRNSGNASCGMCGVGEGGCSSDAECSSGLVCSANICAIPGTPAPVSIPRLISGLAAGGAGPFPESHYFNVSAASDMMVSINVNTSTTASVTVDAPASAWITVDGVKVARRIRLRSNVGPNVVTFKHVPISAGDHVVGVHFDSDQADLDRVWFFAANDNPYELMPFVIGNGDLQAEAFDVGGFVDLTSGNAGGAVRFEDPDIFNEAGVDFVLMDAEEELSHEILASRTTSLTLGVRYRSAIDQDVEILIDGAVVLQETLSAAADWQIKRLGDVEFLDGKSLLTIRTPAMPLAATEFEFDHYRLKRRWTSGPISGVPWPADGSRIQAEYFDIKGFEDSDDNSMDEFHYRSDTDQSGNAPDIWHFRDAFETDDPVDNRYFVWRTLVDDALIYTIEAGDASDQIVLHYASPNTTNVDVYLDAGLIGSAALPPSGGWGKHVNHWDDFVINGLDLSGGGELKLVFRDSGFNLDWIEVGTP